MLVKQGSVSNGTVRAAITHSKGSIYCGPKTGDLPMETDGERLAPSYREIQKAIIATTAQLLGPKKVFISSWVF